MISREQFIWVAARALRKYHGASPEQQAAAVADDIETAMQLARGLAGGAPGRSMMSDEAPPAAPTQPWPTVNPAAVQAQPEQEPMVKLATSIPDAVDLPPVVAVPRLRKIEQPAAPSKRVSVEQLNMLIQERTPTELVVDIPNLDGTTFKATLNRNVLSAHAEDCVKLLYFHPKSPNELSVEESLHISDVPFDMPAILEKLRRQAAHLLRPRDGPIQSVAPSTNVMPVTTDRTYDTGGSTLPQGNDANALAGVFRGR